jgi:Ca2+:H+ antiporter
MVAASLIGAISFNLLLALGLSFLIGGYRFRTQTFNATAAATYSAMMFIAVISLALPSMYDQLFASEAKLAEQESLNLGLACILIVLYVLYLLFMLKTHPDTFASVTPGRDAAETEHGPLPGGPRRRVGNGGGAE